MSNELIAAIVGLLLAITALVKVWTDIAKLKKDRMETKESRDRDSQELHDTVLKHSMQIQTLKDTQLLHNTVMSDMQEAMNELNVNCAKLSVVVEQLTETVKELRGQKS